MGANYQRWATANPELAAKLKKGQAGYGAVSAAQKKANSPSTSSMPQRGGDGAGAQRTSSAQPANKRGGNKRPITKRPSLKDTLSKTTKESLKFKKKQ